MYNGRLLGGSEAEPNNNNNKIEDRPKRKNYSEFNRLFIGYSQIGGGLMEMERSFEML